MTDELESLRSALQAAERERDEAIAGRDAAIRRANAGHKATQERDSARLEAGRLAQELVEVTGKLVLAEVEVGRLREALTTADDTLCDYINAHDEEAQGALLEDLEKTLSEALEPKEVTGG